MSDNNWKNMLFEDAVDVNPERKLKKGLRAKCVPMEFLEPYNRKIQSFVEKEYSGGSKFRNQDTLMARITPCLENGKTAYVDILGNDEIGFGSTEYIVLTGKPGISDNRYIYYLSTSPQIRNIAIQSMVGSSGRQRVQEDYLLTSEILLPSLSEQQRIASTLSSLDDKIELNRKMNKTLEDMARALFRHWFVDFEFPNEEGKPYKSSGGEMVESELGLIPKGWEPSNLGEFIEVNRGLSYKGKHLVESGMPMINLGNFGGENQFLEGKLKYYNGTYNSRSVVKTGDIVIANTDITQSRIVLGSSFIVPSRIASEIVLFTHHVYGVINKGKTSNFFIQSLLSTKDFKSFATSYATGTTVLFLPKEAILDYSFAVPPRVIVQKYDEIIKVIAKKIDNNCIEANKLTLIRNSLLPKLMSGKIRVL